jgi:ribonuclease HI
VSDLFAETEPTAPPARRLPRVEIYTDGAGKRNPDGPSGWGVVLSSGRHRKEMHGGSASTTNNRTELTAVIEAINALKGPSEVQLFTDSEYVRRGITEWIHIWRKRGWTTADKRPVRNSELWRALDDAARRHHIQWRWVRGHDGNPGNERADVLANLGAAEHASSRPSDATATAIIDGDYVNAFIAGDPRLSNLASLLVLAMLGRGRERGGGADLSEPECEVVERDTAAIMLGRVSADRVVPARRRFCTKACPAAMVRRRPAV